MLDKNFYYHLLEYIHKDCLIIRSDNFNSMDEVAIIVTASLKQWKNYCYTLSYSYKMKEFSYLLYQLIKNLGYTSIFNEFKIEETLDGSKQLVKR